MSLPRPLLATLAVPVLMTCGLAAAQPTYPNRPIRFIVPYPPGGPTDIIGRTVNERLGQRLGQPVIIDNRGGAATVIGTEIAARAPADGYTLLLATITTLAVNPALKSKLPYDVQRDFAPVSMLATQPYLLVCHPSVAATTVGELVALARSRPGKLNFASSGIGAGAHLAGEMLKHSAKIDVIHVPYKGSGPAMADLMAGQVNYMFGGISGVFPHVQSGKLRALGVSTEKRSGALPNTPTIAESGVPGFATNTWNSLVVPRGTPEAIVQRLNAEVGAILNDPGVRERMQKQGIDAAPSSPAELAAYIKVEMVRFDQLIKAIGLKTD